MSLFAIILVLHFLGLSLILGAFFVQLGRKQGFQFGTMLIGAITQLVTGLAMVGLAEASGDSDLSYTKIAVKTIFAVVVLVAVIIARSRQAKALSAGTSEKKAVIPFMHIAGLGALINVFVAVLWH